MNGFTELVERLRLYKSEEELVSVLNSLNGVIYPLEGLHVQHSDDFFRTVLHSKTLCRPSLITKWTHLVHSLLTAQNSSLTPGLANDLFVKILSLIEICPDPTEPLYAMSALVLHVDLPLKIIEGLFVASSSLFNCLTDSRVRVQRATLECLSSLCNHVDISPLVLNGLLELLLQLLNQAIQTHQPQSSLLNYKFQLSILRTMYNILASIGSLQPVPLLPSLLASLKAIMTTGLPGHYIKDTPLPLSPHPDAVIPIDTEYQHPSVAGPRQKRHKKRTSGANKTHDTQSMTSSTSVMLSHSGSEGETNSDGRREKGRRHVGGSGIRIRSSSNMIVCSTSESEQSDADSGPINIKDVSRRIRHNCLMCLTAIFQSLDRHSAFSYGLTFLPDSPRLPSAPPTLLTCLCKDPIYKCRNAAIAVLSSILEGSRPFMAVANDRPVPSHAYTPYSTTLGGVIQELHRSLSVAITTEPHPQTLTHILKCLSILIINTPYRTLSKQYISGIATIIQPLANRTDTDISVGSLTCYGAILSLNPPVPEVQVWLKDQTTGQFPWIVEHCLMLIKSNGTPQSLKMEAIQVLTAVIKFNFHVIRSSWLVMSNVYCKYMCRFSEPLQQHSLKYLEELGRAIYNETKDILEDVIFHWEAILKGPLTHWLQDGYTYPSPCSQACSVLATIGNDTLQGLNPPTKVLVQTVLLGLSRDENSSIKASAMRSLGIFCQYQCLSDDPGFLIDCGERIKEGLALNQQLAVRTQAGWAIGNLTDSFQSKESRTEVLPILFHSLVDCSILAMKDNEKVKVNAVRASGNLLKILNSNVPCSSKSHVTIMCSLLTEAVNNGGMKTRWNACYACHNALKNDYFTSNFQQSTLIMLEALCIAVTTSKTFKVRTNAALALGSLTSFPTRKELINVWSALLKAAESTDQQQDFTEYKQANTLKQQLCFSLCQLIMQFDQAILSDMPLSLPLVLSTQLIQYVQHSRQIDSEGNPSNTNVAVEKAYDTLKKFNATLIQEVKGLSELVKIFEVKLDVCH